jgi:hypothetical protein
VPSIGRDYRTGREEHPVGRRCRRRPGNASRSWACQRTPKGEKQNTPFCRTFGKSDLSGTPVCDTEARAVLLLLVVDAVYVRTREATDPGPARYPSEPKRMGRIFNHPRAQGARPVRATVVRWPFIIPPPEPSGFSYRLRHGPISMSSPDSDLLRRGIIVASS